jgi:hypothetical protein
MQLQNLNNDQLILLVTMQTWNPKDSSSDSFAPSSVEMLHIIEETRDAFFHFSIPMWQCALLCLLIWWPDLINVYIVISLE